MIENQISAIKESIKELQRDRQRAVSADHKEWIEDIDKNISELTDAIKTIKAMKALLDFKSIISGL